MEEREEDQSSLPSTQLIQLAQSHLQLRNFTLCRQYALEIQQSSDSLHVQNRRYASQLIAMADVLSASEQSPINWYTILRLDHFCTDLNLIRTRFRNLLMLLTPLKGKLKYALDAWDMVWQAWNVLSNPIKKEQLDAQLKLGLEKQMESAGSGSSSETFWTFCPYCYYMFEYSRVFEGCGLRCPNVDCRRVFHGVSMKNAPPTELEKGQYLSTVGYFPLGYQGTERAGKRTFGSWSPFVSMGQLDEKKMGFKGKMNDINRNVDKFDAKCIEISDESEDSEAPIKDSYVEEVSPNGGNVRAEAGGTKSGEVPNGMAADRPRGMHRKTVAWNTKKMMCTGRRNKLGENSTMVDREIEVDSDDDNVDESGFESTHGIGSGIDLEAAGDGVEFFEEDGEIYVDLPPGDDTF